MTIQAAGGVVVRGGPGPRQVAVVHRPRYDDWSLPKGKLAAGEDAAAAALREVEEETGIRCALGRELTPVAYHDRKGRLKRVRWWLLRPLDGEFAPGDEVDAMRWLGREEALALLDYEHDCALVREALGG